MTTSDVVWWLNDLRTSLGDAAPTISRCRTRFDVWLHGKQAQVDLLPLQDPTLRDGRTDVVLRIRTPLGRWLRAWHGAQAVAGAADVNAFATLGALYREDDGRWFAGSRVTLHEGERAWSALQCPLLREALLHGVDALTEGYEWSRGKRLRRADGGSLWREQDFRDAAPALKGFARFSYFGPDEIDAWIPVAAVRAEAKLELRRLGWHVQAGGGVACCLVMPGEYRDDAHRAQLCQQLNCAEMAALDLPPHLGAWGDVPDARRIGYRWFLPNALHVVPDVAEHLLVWTCHRARWAAVMLAALGLPFSDRAAG